MDTYVKWVNFYIQINKPHILQPVGYTDQSIVMLQERSFHKSSVKMWIKELGGRFWLLPI